MFHVRVSQSLNLRFGVFTVLLFHTALLALIHPCRGQHRVISPSKPIVALVGEDVILPSVLDPPVNTFDMTVEWTRRDLDPRFVLVWRDGVELENKKHPSYVGRASVFNDELKHGNVSLKLSKVKISDGGTYRCFIPDFNIDSTVQLVVGQPQVVGPAQPIVALVGEDIILPSVLDPPVNAFDMTVEWMRRDLDPRFVLVWRDGVELENKKHPSYVGRASVFTDELKRGNISLKLSEVKISDGGTYRCFIPDFNIVSTVQLVAGAASSPVVQMTKNRSAVVLQCESKGWYPEPEVSWLDGEGHVLSAGPTETVRGPDGLYTVSSRVTVEKRHNNNFTCRVQQKDINQIRQAHIYISDYFLEVQSSSAPAITTLAVLLAFCSMFIFAVFFFVCKWRQKIIKIKRRHGDDEDKESSLNPYKWFKDEHQMREEAEREVESLNKQLTEEKTNRETERRELQTKLENKETELSEEKKNRETERRELETELKNKETELSEEKKNRETERRELKTKLKNKETEVVKLTAEVMKLTDEKKRSEEDLKKEKNKLTDDKKKIEEELKGELEKKTEELTEEKKNRETERRELQTKLKNKETEVGKLEAEVKKITEEKTSVENEQQKLQTELKITRAKVKKLTEEKMSVENKLENKTKELTDDKKKIEEELKEKKEELEKKTKELSEEKKDRETERRELKTKLENKETEQEKSKSSWFGWSTS